MTRSTHLPHPSPDDVRALLDQAGLTPYAAAPLAGVTARQMQRVVAGDSQLSGTAWQLLRVSLSASARRQLPTPLIK